MLIIIAVAFVAVVVGFIIVRVLFMANFVRLSVRPPVSQSPRICWYFMLFFYITIVIEEISYPYGQFNPI